MARSLIDFPFYINETIFQTAIIFIKEDNVFNMNLMVITMKYYIYAFLEKSKYFEK